MVRTQRCWHAHCGGTGEIKTSLPQVQSTEPSRSGSDWQRLRLSVECVFGAQDDLILVAFSMSIYIYTQWQTLAIQ
eukprot:3525622-Rhodomonas_salina.3